MASCAFGVEMTGSWSKLFLFPELQEVVLILMLVRLKIHTVLPAEVNYVVNNRETDLQRVTNPLKSHMPRSSPVRRG